MERKYKQLRPYTEVVEEHRAEWLRKKMSLIQRKWSHHKDGQCLKTIKAAIKQVIELNNEIEK